MKNNPLPLIRDKKNRLEFQAKCTKCKKLLVLEVRNLPKTEDHDMICHNCYERWIKRGRR